MCRHLLIHTGACYPSLKVLARVFDYVLVYAKMMCVCVWSTFVHFTQFTQQL